MTELGQSNDTFSEVARLDKGGCQRSFCIDRRQERARLPIIAPRSGCPIRVYGGVSDPNDQRTVRHER
jgi:hypothetical protein